MLRRFLILNFRVVHAASRWSHRRFTMAGRVVLGAALAAGVLGFDTYQNLSYQLFAVLLALLIVAMSSVPFLRSRFDAERVLPSMVTVNQPFTYRVSVRSHSRRVEQELRLVDELTQHPPTAEAFERVRQPGEERLNWFDRLVGYPRWAWLMHRQAGARVSEVPLPALAPGSENVVKVTATPLRRGYVRFDTLVISRPDPLGLCKALMRIPSTDRLLVLPRRYRLPPIQLPGQRRYQRGGVAAASNVGDSEEFISLRDYRPGDPRRHIHWRSWARAGKPIVKEFQDEFFVRHALILDTFAAPADLGHFEEAVSVAASFVDNMLTQDALVDLMFVGPEPFCFTAGRGLGSGERFLQVLACVEPADGQPFSALLQAVTTHAKELSGCVCVLLKWDEVRQQLVEQVRSWGVPVLVLVLVETGTTELPSGPMADAPHMLQALPPGQIQERLSRL